MSEFGLPELGYTAGSGYPTAAVNPFAAQTNGQTIVQHIQEAFDWGVPYLELWTLYDNGCSQFNPPSNTDGGCPGFWMIEPEGNASTTYALLKASFSAP